MLRLTFGLIMLVTACSSNHPTSGTPEGKGPSASMIRYGLVSGAAGIQRFTFNPANATLALVDTQVSTLANPSFLAFTPSKKVVYVAEEGGNKVHAYTYADDAALTEIGSAKDANGGPPFVGVDSSGRYVLAANFNEGTVRVWGTNSDGSLGDVTANATLGTGAHQMPVHPTKPVAYVPCRDDEHVYVFDFAGGALTNQRSVAVADNAGPRHLVFHPSLNYAYLITEFAGTVIRYAVASDGSLSAAGTPVSLLQTAVDGDKSAAEIAIAPSGRFMYASVRGVSNVIAVLSIDAHDGSLTLLANVSAHGTKPRQFSLDGSGQWLFVANEITNDVSVFAVDTASGALTYKSTLAVGNDPEFVALLP